MGQPGKKSTRSRDPVAGQEEVVQCLDASPANGVYWLAPKDFVLRGFEYYRDERLESWRWDEEQAGLVAVVRGSRRYRVDIAAEHGDLAFSCDCPAWTPETHCKHVICAFLTAKHALDPRAFAVPTHSPARMEALRRALLGPRERETPAVGQAQPIELVISVRQGTPELSLRRGGLRVVSPHQVPPDLLPLVTRGVYGHPFIDGHLPHLLNRHPCPIVLDTGAGETALTWDPALQGQAVTDLDLTEGRVTVRGVCQAGRTLIRNFYRIGTLVADLDQKRLGVVREAKGWIMYDRWREALRWGTQFDHDGRWPAQARDRAVIVSAAHFGDGSPLPFLQWRADRPCLSVPLAEFERVQTLVADAALNRFHRQVILSHAGAPVSLAQPERTEYGTVYRVNLDVGTPLATLTLECRVGDATVPPSQTAFAFFHELEHSRRLPPALQAQKRKAVLHEAAFRLLEAKDGEEAAAIIDGVARDPDFRRLGVEGLARLMLKEFLDRLHQPEARLLAVNGRWALVPVDRAREAALYRVPYRLFGPQVFRDMPRPDALTIPREQVEACLAQLLGNLEEAGIALHLGGKPVVRARWEVSLLATPAPAIDWFELRPEITCDGASVDDRLLRRALEGRGVIEQADSVQVLDPVSCEALAMLRSLQPAGRSRKADRGAPPLIPRLQMLDWLTLRARGVRVRLPEEEEALFQRLLRFERIAPYRRPEGLRTTLRPYQEEGYTWLAFLYEHRLGACLADDMGLGKTIQAITLLGALSEGLVPRPTRPAAPHLVVVPASLVFNWEQEIARFYPGLRTRLYTGTERRAEFQDCDLVLTTYGLVRRDIETLERRPFDVLLFDEAQALKNPRADTTAAARRLKSRFTLVMTGTPLENHLGEYRALIDLCLPGLLGAERQGAAATIPDAAQVDTILRRTRPFVLRRTKEQILSELPPKTEMDVYLDLTERQKALYQHTVAQLRPEVHEAFRRKTAPQARIIALTAILKLRQLCLSPRLLHPSLSDASPKIDFLLGRLTELLEAGHSALVFSQFTSYLDLVEARIRAHRLPYHRLDGRTAAGARKARVQAFQEGDASAVFLLSLKAGGQGLNLVKASYVFHLDPWWNPAVENQASDRAHRIGQRRAVSVTRILMRHTIEDKMMELKRRKRALFEAIMQGAADRGAGAALTRADVDFLLGGLDAGA